MIDSEQRFRVFSAADVRAALPMDKAVEAMKGAFRELSTGEVTVPLRTHMVLPEHQADVLVMSCYSPRLAQVGIKLLTLHPGNADRGLPFIQATVMVVDAETGTPQAVMSGAVLTSIRTGAASGAATDVLARPDVSHVAIFGSGIQATTQLEAVCTVRDIRSAAVFDMDHARARAFAQQMEKHLEIEISAAASPSEALAGADVVCTATTSRTPVFDDADVEPGTHINAIGVYKTDEREIPGATVARARVVVDEVDAAWEEAGELVLARDEGLIETSHIHAELGDILAGKQSGRANDSEITLFKSVGIANQDLSAAHVVLARGTKLGLGSAVSL
jgi:ornithine cyclodeaminase/alanine dehydrogenase-like protein (mu-crystallin family)